MERKPGENRGRAGLARTALWFLLVAALVYLLFVAGADLITARLYDLVWAVADS